MLDSETQGLTEDTAEDTVEGGEDTLAAVEPEEIVIAIEGEEPEPDEDAEIEAELGERGKNAVAKLRLANKQKAARLRELEAKLAEKEQPKAEPELKRPTLEDCGFNEDAYAEQMAVYVAAKKDADAKREAEEAKTTARETAYEEKRARYHAEKAKVGVDDDAEAVVVSALSNPQQAALMDASLDPAKVVAALSKTPKILAELAGITEIHKFTYRLAQIEGKITMTTKAPPPPESKLRGAVASPGGSLASQLAAAEAKADSTGDRSEVVRIKRQMAAAGVKA
jgi:hypothetical protein